MADKLCDQCQGDVTQTIALELQLPVLNVVKHSFRSCFICYFSHKEQDVWQSAQWKEHLSFWIIFGAAFLVQR